MSPVSLRSTAAMSPASVVLALLAALATCISPNSAPDLMESTKPTDDTSASCLVGQDRFAIEQALLQKGHGLQRKAEEASALRPEAVKSERNATALISAATACSSAWQQCGGEGWTGSICCEHGYSCDFENDWYSSCKPADAREPASPSGVSARAAAPSPPPTHSAPSTSTGEWITGTWTTGYWDCCKPSCSWPGKGKLRSPIKACSIKTGLFSDPMDKSVCDGGDSTTCSNNQPFVVPGTGGRYSMGFAAGAAGGASGLSGDENCGQCYELIFVDKKHPEGNWGGSHPDLVDKRMVIQVTNIGYDVNGQHSFDIQIPGAGRGIFKDGCAREFFDVAATDVGAFDCDKPYGGCDSREGCRRLPTELRPGCEWRYDWFRWLMNNGQTNNPYIQFRRVRCPAELVAISGAAPSDDDSFPEVDFNA